MRNRIVGFIIIGIALLICFITYSFNKALSDIVSTSCSHGSECPMWGSINAQTSVSIGITAFVGVIGLYLIFFGEEEKIITKIKKIREQIEGNKITKGNYKKIMKKMGNEEKVVFGKIIDSNGSIFQSEIVERTKFNKVKVTRILDRLEGMNLIERKRRGMTNIIILKH